MAESELRRPYQPRPQAPATIDYALVGMQTGLSAIVTSVLAGAVAFARGNKAFYDKMFRVRMVIVATTFGFYASSSGWLPPPPLLNTIMGKEPRPLPDAPQLSPMAHRRPPA